MSPPTSSPVQRELFSTARLPPGFVYAPEFLGQTEEARLLAVIGALPLQEARYRTFTARRRIVSFGAGYDFSSNRPTPAPPLPPFLVELRERAAGWAGIAPLELVQSTVAEYSPGTQLGWHRDAAPFGLVIGISLASPCRMRLRPYPHAKQARAAMLALTLEPRSIYVFRDAARWGWQHAISPTRALRYSITFRTMPRAGRARRDAPEASP